VLIINIFTRINLGAFRQERNPQSAPDHICRPLGFMQKNIANVGICTIFCIFGTNKEIFSTPNHTNIIQTSKYLPLVQYSEIILLASECEYKTGNMTTAINYLNQIRNRDDLIPATSESYNTDLKETWKTTMTGGFSYFSFLKRNGLIASELNIQDYQQLFPIPSSELMANPSMKQNPGYGF